MKKSPEDAIFEILVCIEGSTFEMTSSCNRQINVDVGKKSRFPTLKTTPES